MSLQLQFPLLIHSQLPIFLHYKHNNFLYTSCIYHQNLNSMDYYWSSSLYLQDELQKLLLRMNPPRVSVDNDTDEKATLIKVDSVNKRGSLLEVVQVMNDLNLIIKKAYISSDGGWFMDVFHVTDQYGNKLTQDDVIFHVTDRIQQSLVPTGCCLQSKKTCLDFQSATEHTSIELTGRDRPGLLSEIFAVLTDLKCNIVGAQVWTHNSRMASVVYITDESNGSPIDDPDRLANIKRLLLYILKGDSDHGRTANTEVSLTSTHTERRLHQMMYADRDYDDDIDCMHANRYGTMRDGRKAIVTVENFSDKGYTVVNVRCPDRPKLLFDTVCTLTDMQYVVSHATIIAEGPEASQEYYIRHMDGYPVSSEGERLRIINCLEAAVKRRASEGVRLELCGKDRVGLLSHVTRIFRENGLSLTRAEVATRGSEVANVFYAIDVSGNPVKSETIEAVRKEIGDMILNVKEDGYLNSAAQESGGFSLSNLLRTSSEKFLYNLGLNLAVQESGGFSLSNLFRTRSEKFLYNLGLIKSCS